MLNEGRVKFHTNLGFLVVLFLSIAGLVGCSSINQSGNSASTGTVNTTLSDPPTCTGTFSSVFVTVTKVEANLSSSAGPNDNGWQTLVDLTSSPVQVDLMKLNPTATPGFCGTLFTLGQKVLPAGKYQQIRLILLSNSPASGTATPSNNACGAAGFNCVVPNGSSTPAELQLSSQDQTGIKIPSSQITSGGLTVMANQSVDLNIDIDSCASIVREGNGQYRFKPVLHAGEVTLNTNTISGSVVEASNGPNPGSPVPNAIVLLEQPDPNNSAIDRVVMSGLTQQDGTFAFCPLMSSNTNFDVVVSGQTTQQGALTTTTTYNPTVVFNVPVGGATGNIPLYAETTSTSGTGLTSTLPGTISGQIASSAAGNTPVAGDVELSALQSVTNGSNTISITVPVFQAASQPPNFTTNTTTSSGGGCATSTADCIGYSLLLPASSPAIGTFSSSSAISFTAPSSTTQATYTVNALADGSNELLTCSPASVTSNSVNVTPGSTVNAASEPTLNFSLTGCSAP